MATSACECFTNDLANVTNSYECPCESCNACKRLKNETSTQRMHRELHINPLTMLLNIVESLKSHGHAPKHGNRSPKKL
jgi:hypothetical protein